MSKELNVFPNYTSSKQQGTNREDDFLLVCYFRVPKMVPVWFELEYMFTSQKIFNIDRNPYYNKARGNLSGVWGSGVP